MITTLEKGFHALLLGVMFMLMMSLLKAQIPSEPSELVSEMETYMVMLKNVGLLYGILAVSLFLLGFLSLWVKDTKPLVWLKENSVVIGFVFNFVSFAVIAYFIGWFWVIPC